MSMIAIGTEVPGVVSAPRTATSPSTPPMIVSQPSSSDSASATACMRLRLVRTIAASATAFSRETSPASPPRTTAGHEGVDGEDVTDPDLRGRLPGHVGHRVADLREHAADVRAGLAVDVVERRDPPDRFHDRVGALVDADVERAAGAREGQRADGDAPVGDVAGRGAHDDRGAVARERPRHRGHLAGLLGVQVERRGQPVGVRQGADGAPGRGHLDRGEHPQRHPVDRATPRRPPGCAASGG